GMQFPLPTNAPQQLWTEANGNPISRVFMYYDSLITYNVTATQLTSNSFSFTNGADTSFSAVWNFGDNSPLDPSDNPTHTFTSSGTYNVCSYITNSCGTDTVCTTVTVCAPVAASYTSSAAGGTISFTDQTTANPTTWAWDFGDSSPINTQQNPTHTYAASGTYTVCLIASNGCSADTSCNVVTVCIGTTANFTSAITVGSVQFTDASLAEVTSWSWDFGDNSPLDNTQNPQHTYATNGTYQVCLIASSPCSSDTFCTSITICYPVTSNYTYTVNGATATFTDASSNATTWIYDYGDASPLDTVQNGSHTYSANGTYIVCMTAVSSCSTATFCDTINICSPITAAYTSSINGGTATFTDASSNATQWIYDYGDNSPLDTIQNGSHTYTSNGNYLVCMTAISSCTTATFCDTITICMPAVANFSWAEGNASILFSDSSQHATSWAWDFGDNSPIDTAQNATHLYSQNGVYTVCLIVTNECSSDTFCTTITICIYPANATFTASGTGFNYNFTNTSNNAVSYFWDFDDNGATSTLASPSHTFSYTGLHIVCLTAYNLCNDSVTTCDSVLVQVVDVNDNLTGATQVAVYPNPVTDASVLQVQSTEISGAFTFELIDVTGRIVRTENGIINETTNFNRNDLAAGIYTYRIVHESHIIGTGKLVIN
ncbi:MAG: PKD domain-containing protein, partial [Bacteroidia bacterium]